MVRCLHIADLLSMTGLPPAIGGHVPDPQRNPTPVRGRRVIRGWKLLCRRISRNCPVLRSILISPQCRLQSLGIDLVMLNGSACPDTQGRDYPAKGRMDMALICFFVRFHHIGACGQKRFKARQVKRRRKCHRFACSADGHDGVASAGRGRVRSSDIALSPVCRREHDGLSVTTCLRHDRGDGGL